MKTEDLLYWAAYAIPFILIPVGASAEKLIEKDPWHWKHFYRGLDLMLTVMGAALANVLDVAKSSVASEKKIQELAITALFVATAMFVLFALSGVHQDWQDESKYGKAQIFWLGIASNFVGIVFSWGFVKFKLEGWL
jgi:hypothetical protein